MITAFAALLASSADPRLAVFVTQPSPAGWPEKSGEVNACTRMSFSTADGLAEREPVPKYFTRA